MDLGEAQLCCGKGEYHPCTAEEVEPVCACFCGLPPRLQAVNAMVVGTTHRYKGKYITSVLYKPRGGSSSSSLAAAGGVRRMPLQQPFAGQQQQPLQPQHH